MADSFIRVLEHTFPQLKALLLGGGITSVERGTALVQNTGSRRLFNFFHNLWLKVTGSSVPSTDETTLGRLVALKEAAGKLRTVAIVDPLTQWVLRPVHLWLFRLLAKIREDGTFDQMKAISEFASSRSKWRFVSKATSSLDLSAATDRLPLRLQVLLLSYPFGQEFASDWGHLLTKRSYTKSIKPYFYAVGQPMGALSS